MPEPVRVRDNVTGHEYSTYAVSEDGKVDEGLTVLKGEKALDEHGVLIPPKYPTKAPNATVGARTSEPTPPADSDVAVVEPAQPTATEQPAPVADPPAESEQAADSPPASEPKSSGRKSTQRGPVTEPVAGPKTTSPKEGN